MKHPHTAITLLAAAVILLATLLLLGAPAPVLAQGAPTATPDLYAPVNPSGHVLQPDVNYEAESSGSLNWEWRGQWDWESCASCSEGEHAVSTAQGAIVGFYANGAGITLYRHIGPGRGTINVCISLPVHHCVEVDNENPITQYDQPISINFDSMGYRGPYYIFLIATGGDPIEIDRVRVITPATWLQMPTPWPTVVATPFMQPDAVRYTTELSGNIINGYRWLNTGNVMGGLSFFAMLVIIFSFVMRGIKRLGKR